MSVADRHRDEPYVYLTAVGRVSGEPRRVELWFGAHDGTIYLLAGSGHVTHWVQNVLQQPRVSVVIADEQFTGVARLVEEPVEEQRARLLLAAKYEDWTAEKPLSAWARTALVIAIDLGAIVSVE